jgi:hypothetical protein
VVGAVLVVAGIAVVLTTALETVVTDTASHEPLSCPDGAGCTAGSRSAVLVAGQGAGLGAAGFGPLVLAGVFGRLLGADQQ